MKEYKNLKFLNSAKGQEEKIRILAQESKKGWRVASENIVPGKFKGKDACCLFLIFAPCAFLAGHTEGEIHVTLERVKK
ncbi:MAG: hypothetical protein HQ541_17745 [Mariniphaga sp.]|nr:hypothetical protein [Mariniphaga sp.]